MTFNFNPADYEFKTAMGQIVGQQNLEQKIVGEQAV